MIVVGMSHCHDVNVAQSPIPEVWRDYLFSYIHAADRTSFEGWESATIHKHRAPVRECEKQAISLSYVNGGELQPPIGGWLS